MPSPFSSTTHLQKEPTTSSTMEDSDPVSQEKVVIDDTAKLRMLGYDPMLGRTFGFWSSAGLNFCHMSFIFDFVMYATMYGYPAPLMFLIGYPCLCVLHLILLGPFAELASAFPVAGAMATWAWRCARAGVRHERQWGWLVSGFILAGHLGKAIAHVYNVTMSFEQMYILMSGVPYNPLTMKALDPKDWWIPVFHLTLVSFSALVVLSRIARTSTFWVFAAFYNFFIGVFILTFLVMCYRKTTRHMSVDYGFPTKSKWTHSLSYMIFTGLPLKIASVDAPAHMSEETKNPAKTVPRVLYASTIAHFIMTYLLTAMFIFGIAPYAKGRFSISPVIPVYLILGVSRRTLYAFVCLAMFASTTQLIASVVVTSRFIFALARDYAMPFSDGLYRTNSRKEPWVADLLVIFSLYASVAGWYLPRGNYYNLIQTFWYWFMAIPYIIPLGLYLFSNLELQFLDRTQFTLRRWSKPMSMVAFTWLLLSLIQGTFPVTAWSNVAMPEVAPGQLSSLPFVFLGMVAIMVVSWLVYGQRHYIGPIRALTKWSAGVEINPHDFSTSRGRSKAITDYIQGASQRRKPSKASKVSKSSKAKAKASKESKDSDIPMGPITPANTAVTTIKWVFSGPSTSVHARSERETGAALVESGLLPNTTMRPARGVQVESSLLLPSPYDQHQQHSNANAQIESQLLPETFVDLARSVNIQEEVLKYSHWERY